MLAYLNVMRNIVDHGTPKHPTREGVPTTNSTIGLPNQHLSMSGFPLITTRRLPWKGLVGELRSFLLGCTNNADFIKHGCKFWTPWARPDGDLGPIYGKQWQRDLPHILDSLKNNPYDRRMCCFAWNTPEHKDMVLPPCHLGWVCTVYSGALHLFWCQRSSDWPIGVPINIGSYALLQHLLAKWGNLKVGNLSCLFADAHIYENQLEGVREQLTREPRPGPSVKINQSGTDFNDWDVELLYYHPHSNINFGELEI